MFAYIVKGYWKLAMFTKETGIDISDCEPWLVTVALPTLKSPIGGGRVTLLGLPIEIEAKGSSPAVRVVRSVIVV